MLSRVLPGLREFRTPLSAGLTLMFAVWVAIGDQLAGKGEPFHGFSDRLREASETLGDPSVGAVLVFVGYLVGAVATRISPPRWLEQAVHAAGRPSSRELMANHGEQLPRIQRWSAWPKLARWLRDDDPRTASASLLDDLITERIRRAERAGIEIDWLTNLPGLEYYTTGLAHEFALEPGGTRNAYSDFNVGLLVETLADNVIRELPAIENELLIEKEPLFDRYDRIRSEAEFRIGMTLPIAAVGIALGVRVSSWCIGLLLISSVLFVQGLRRFYAGRAIIWQALSQQLVTSEVLEVFDAAITLEESRSRERPNEE